jgi:hypothetical protein
VARKEVGYIKWPKLGWAMFWLAVAGGHGAGDGLRLQVERALHVIPAQAIRSSTSG